MSEVSLTVNIANRPYKLRVDSQEEDVVKKAVELIEKEMKEYTEQLGYKDKQDLLAMITLQNTSKMLKNDTNSFSVEETFTAKLTEFDQLLTDALVND